MGLALHLPERHALALKTRPHGYSVVTAADAPPAWQTRLLVAAAIVALGAPIALNPPQPRLTGHVTPNETRQP